MVFVALLRGINVGGKNKIDMKKLKASFEALGLLHVVTYINTGNIIFSNSTYNAETIAEVLERKIQEDFGLKIRVLVRSLHSIHHILSSLPKHWTNDDEMKSDVLYLWDEVNEENVLRKLNNVDGVDTVIFVPGAVLWSCKRQDLSRSGMSSLVSKPIYKQVTIRNVNTARKLYELMLECERLAISS